jgi:SsrA-binding protein
MAGSDKRSSFAPRISNRRATLEFFIMQKVECGIVLEGTEVKSVRMGRAQLQEAFAKIENGELFLFGCHIDPYDKASQYNHLPTRDRKLLVHKRELKRLESETSVRGVTLVPLAMYFKNGLVKVELGVARGKREHDKRETIRRKEQDRELRRAMSKKG